MFGFSKNIEPTPSSSLNEEPLIQAYLGKDVRMKGIFRYHGKVRIDGCVEGEVYANGTLEIGEEAVVSANLFTTTLISAGRISGDVIAMDKVHLLSPGSLSGSVKASLLIIEEGVEVNGLIQSGKLLSTTKEHVTGGGQTGQGST